MTTIAALVLTDGLEGAGPPTRRARSIVRFAGMDLTERAARAVHRAGIDHIHIVGNRLPDEPIVRRLRQRGLAVTCTQTASKPFEALPPVALLVVLPIDTVMEPRAVVTLLEQARLGPGEAALAIDRRPEARPRLVDVANGFVRSLLADGHAASSDLAVLTGEAVNRVRGARSARQALQRLAVAGRLRAVSVAPYFCERLHDARDVARLEYTYIRRLNGREQFFTRQIRRVSIRVTRHLLRWPITPNQVTLAAFAFSAAAALFFAAGAYWAGIIGAALYYLSTVLDCSDGEVARVSYRDSSFGAWLETATDYASYFLVLGGIALGSYRVHGYCRHVEAALVALVASIVVVALVAWLRHRTARINPGAFDDALAAVLNAASPFHQFSAWARQLIKRSFFAHLILFQALIGHLPALLKVWAYGASAAVVVLLAVQPLLVRRVRVAPARATVPIGARENA